MQIVIEIPEEMYQKIKETSMVISGRRNGKRIDYILFNAVNTGIPLPKGHGRLIDADAFLKENEDYTGWILDSSAWGGQNAYKDTLEDIIEQAPTIIEAESEGEE